MPRKSKKQERFNYFSLQLNRTVGLEVEGYMRTNPRTVINAGGIPYCEIKRDGSLSNSNWWNDGGMYGVEIVTEPLSQLEPLKTVFDSITSRGWSAMGRAGLHIHVDARDYTFQDKLKFVKFAKRIEDVVFLFVKNRRYNNRYCQMIPQGLITAANQERYTRGIDNYSDFLSRVARTSYSAYNEAYMDRYHWLNIFNSSHRTIEFRMFHPIRSAEDGAMFAYFVHNLVNTVKNSTQAQLDFIAQSIEEQSNVFAKARMLLEAIGVPYDIPVVSERAIGEIMRKQVTQASNLVTV